MELNCTGPVYEGENEARSLSFTVEAPYRAYALRLAFFTPLHRLYLSPALTLTDGAGAYALPARLLDAPGTLEAQLVAESAGGDIVKSAVLKLPVERSVPLAETEVSADGLLTLGALDASLTDLTDTVESLATALQGKQDALQFDAAPTSGSANLVKSGALFAALIGAEGTFTRKNGLWTVKKSKVRQVGTRVFMSLWLDRNDPLGSSQIEIGSITGVSLPTGATLFACATAAGVALTAVHPAAGFVTAAGGAAKVYVQPAEPTDTMVFVNAFYYTEN